MYNGAYTDFNLVYQKPMGTWPPAIDGQSRILRYLLMLTFALRKYNYPCDPVSLRVQALPSLRPKLLMIPEIVQVANISYYF